MSSVSVLRGKRLAGRRGAKSVEMFVSRRPEVIDVAGVRGSKQTRTGSFKASDGQLQVDVEQAEGGD